MVGSRTISKWILGLTFIVCSIQSSFSQSVWENHHLQNAFTQQIIRDTIGREGTINLLPFYHAGVGFYPQNSLGEVEWKSHFRGLAGVNLKYSGKKFKASTFLGWTGLVNPVFQAQQVSNDNSVAFVGRVSGSVKAYYGSLTQVNLNYQIEKHIAINAGYGKNHVGYGLRSPFLDRQSANYPYAGIELKGGVLQYDLKLLYTEQSSSGSDDGKWVSTHTLEAKLAKGFKLFLAEMVVWQNSNNGHSRGLDINYINPLVVFRPVEFNVGSPDNVLLGAGSELKWGAKRFYFQFLLDEFLLDNIREQNGWWANKYAFQFGLAFPFSRDLDKSLLQMEYQLVRPFTYSHRHAEQGLTANGLPLASPLGSNFHEILLKAFWKEDNYTLSLLGFFWMKGENTGGFNYGADPTLAYNNRVRNFGNYILQGENRHSGSLQLQYMRKLKKINPFIKAGLIYGKTSEVQNINPFVEVGISTAVLPAISSNF